MTNLSSPHLLQLVTAAIGGVPEPSELAPKPVVFQMPDGSRVRVYLWTVTPDMSTAGRPWDEHKAQIILPFSRRGDRQLLTVNDIPTFIMGYSPVFGVFVFWEARRHQNSAYSKNLQVKQGLMEQASAMGWAIAAPRRTQQGLEVRAAIHPAHVPRFIAASIEADTLGLAGVTRASYLGVLAPDLEGSELSVRAEAGEVFEMPEIDRQRVATVSVRLQRSAGFADEVLTACNKRCAVCGMQLTILDGAHIVPVHHPQGVDEVWNGLAMCKNHHALFDRRILLIDGNAIVRVDAEIVATLETLDCLGGYAEVIAPFVDKPLRFPPRFFGVNKPLTLRLQAALQMNYEFAPA